jgi:hypothetical protein
MSVSLSTNIVTISKFFEQRENEDFAYNNSLNEDFNLWVICDGAGGAGVFCKEWAKFIAENLPINPLELQKADENWFVKLSENFYENVLSKANLSDLILSKKIHRDGSNSTMSALWLDKKSDGIYFTNIGDSCIFYFSKMENTLILKFITPYNSFNEIEPPCPILLNWNEPTGVDLNLDTYKGENDFIIIIASDSLARWIIQTLSIINYEAVSNIFNNKFLQSLNEGKYENRKISIRLNNDHNSILGFIDYLKELSESQEVFKNNLKMLFETEQIDLDDYSLIFINGYVSK